MFEAPRKCESVWLCGLLSRLSGRKPVYPNGWPGNAWRVSMNIVCFRTAFGLHADLKFLCLISCFELPASVTLWTFVSLVRQETCLLEWRARKCMTRFYEYCMFSHCIRPSRWFEVFVSNFLLWASRKCDFVDFCDSCQAGNLSSRMEGPEMHDASLWIMYVSNCIRPSRWFEVFFVSNFLL